MRAILIDPRDCSVDEVNLPDFTDSVRRKFGGAKLVHVATLPTGDRVHLVATDAHCAPSFSLGGSGPHHGLGLILGRRGLYGLFMNSKSDVEGIAAILKFNSVGGVCHAKRTGKKEHRGKLNG